MASSEKVSRFQALLLSFRIQLSYLEVEVEGMETPGIVYDLVLCLSVLCGDCQFETELLRTKVRTSEPRPA